MAVARQKAVESARMGKPSSRFRLMRAYLRLVDDSSVLRADLQRQVSQVTLHRVQSHPQRHHETVDQQEHADQAYQLGVLEQLESDNCDLCVSVGEADVDFASAKA